jgi:hypothetical protein
VSVATRVPGARLGGNSFITRRALVAARTPALVVFVRTARMVRWRGETMTANFRRGDLVEVRSPAEVLATLDETAALDGLPFMPEMVPLCGRRFRVERRAERVCDTVHYSGTRRLADAVFLEQERCDGAGHGGCQAECRSLWKEAWLRAADAATPAAGPFSADEIAALVARATAGTRTPREGEQRWRCQATELPGCTEHVKLWDPRGYLRELTSGNVGMAHFARVMSRAVIQEPMRKMGLVDEVHVRGTASKGDAFPALDLQPGERVRVKSRQEIAKTLNAEGRNKGLWFDREMLPYCGQVFRVRQRVRRFINDHDGKMVDLKNEAITLEGVVCSGDLSHRRWFCSRELYPYWRECWLERVDPAVQMPEPGSARAAGGER